MEKHLFFFFKWNYNNRNGKALRTLLLKEQFKYLKTTHSYHLVDPSPWPIVAAFGAFMLTSGGVLYMHKFIGGWNLFLTGFTVIIYAMYTWWRDVIREATFEDQHTVVVQKGLRLGMILFIVSEVMFFFAFFWAFFHSSVAPVYNIGGVWPPKAITTINTYAVPLTNTFLLLTSGATVTWAHHAILVRAKKHTLVALIFTLVLASLFTGLQVLEYVSAPFSISDGVYGSCFFLATGFHGFHVFIGTIALLVSFIRIVYNHFTDKHHFGFESAIWYWHFVDVVWLFLFINVYWWSSSSDLAVVNPGVGTPVLKNYTVNVILLTSAFFILVAALHRFTSFAGTLYKINPNALKLFSAFTSIILAYGSYQCKFDLGILFSLAIIAYGFYLTYVPDYFNDILDKSGEVLKSLSETTTIIIIFLFILIAFWLNYIYLTFSLTVALLLRVLKNNTYNPLYQYFRNREYNLMVRKYHRPREFPILYHLINIMLVTLALSILYPIVLKILFHQSVNQKVYFQTIGYFCFVLMTLNLLYNLYIIRFSNFASKQTPLELGISGLKGCVAFVALEFSFEELGIMDPTQLTKIPRKSLGLHVFEANSQKEYQAALNATLPVRDRDKFFTEVGIYGPPGTKYPFVNPNLLVEKPVVDAGTLASTNNNLELLGNQEEYDLLITYKVFDPETAKLLADSKKEVISQTATKAQMDLLYPESRNPPMATGEITHKHDVSLKPFGLGSGKK